MHFATIVTAVLPALAAAAAVNPANVARAPSNEVTNTARAMKKRQLGPPYTSVPSICDEGQGTVVCQKGQQMCVDSDYDDDGYAGTFALGTSCGGLLVIFPS